MFVNFKAHAIPAGSRRRNASGSRAQEGIEHRVTDETEHTYEALRMRMNSTSFLMTELGS
jgi:hypothetical protein